MKDLKEKKKFFNDPSSFDSLAISYYNQYKNLSGYYVDFNLERSSTLYWLIKSLFEATILSEDITSSHFQIQTNPCSSQIWHKYQ